MDYKMVKLMGKYLVLFADSLSYNKCYSHAGWSCCDIQLFFLTDTVQYTSIIYQQVISLLAKRITKADIQKLG